MIDYLKGSIAHKNPTQITLDVGGIGYEVQISLHTYAKIEKLENTQLLIHYYVNQQDYVPALFGFADSLERNIFRHLISVSGISVNSGRMILSSMSPDDVRNAIVSDNETAFRSVKGVGVKTAKRIILDLKDKLIKEGGETLSKSGALDNTLRDEALSALIALQIPKISAQKALNKVLKESPNTNSVEDLIKRALKQLS